jgi:hypothetical protein
MSTRIIFLDSELWCGGVGTAGPFLKACTGVWETAPPGLLVFA